MFGAGFFSKAERITPIQFLILLQLRKQPMYGYEILKSLRNQFGGIWEPKTGTIYPALKRLETRGFIQTELKKDKEIYSLTETGKEILKGASELLKDGLEFAEKYYSFLPLSHRGKIMGKMMERISHRRLPLFLPFQPNKFGDKETRIRNLKMMREDAQKWLQAIDKGIKKLESEGDEKSKSKNTRK